MKRLFGKLRCWLRGGHGPFSYSRTEAVCSVCGKFMGTIPASVAAAWEIWEKCR